jgi:hypothetical protein
LRRNRCKQLEIPGLERKWLDRWRSGLHWISTGFSSVARDRNTLDDQVHVTINNLTRRES